MQKQKILVATSNEGKFREIKKFLSDLPFELLSLNDIKKKIITPAETESSLEGNAILKAKYYSLKTGLITISEDAGLFIDALAGWPGVASARVGNSDASRSQKVLQRMIGKRYRQAVFRTAMVLYNPYDVSMYVSIGETKGKILKAPVLENKNGFGYDPIFFVNNKGKTYAEMDANEKNSCSHRGKALIKMKYFLQNSFSPKQIVCPVAIIVDKGKFLITKRNDPHRPDYHEKWEFPGGGVEWGEKIDENLRRETLEETGYMIKPLKQLNHIYIANQQYPTFSYQVYLIPFVCKLASRSVKVIDDAEVLDMKWIRPEMRDISKYKFVGENLALIKIILPELKKTIKDYHL